ncbi:caffeoyl-CoA O-methyltransferase 3-like [Vigna unguiculata]|uniref:caffeoyl-CoA O-methyltransferase 3-like n=1 Tax=Vigna unguiculata TaxID=3917 RepID=UPI0010160747|nr:caffeoyl-CoA O-methyltransferase 3-like [Vigna unguiculata]
MGAEMQNEGGAETRGLKRCQIWVASSSSSAPTTPTSIIEKAGVAHKINFKEGHVLPFLTSFLKNENKKGTFNFVFVDGDKNNYLNYHKRVIDLVKVGGLIGYDNTLWVGSVAAPPDALLMDYIKPLRIYVLELNKYLGQDSRIEIFQLSVGDEITLCRRII